MSDSITQLRKYRIKLENNNGQLFNSNNDGIAIFDLAGTFIIAYALDYYFNVWKFLGAYFKNPRMVYYLLLIPFGVVIHKLFVKNETFLNSKLFSKELNIYKILLFVMLMVTISYIK